MSGLDEGIMWAISQQHDAHGTYLCAIYTHLNYVSAYSAQLQTACEKSIYRDCAVFGAFATPCWSLVTRFFRHRGKSRRFFTTTPKDPIRAPVHSTAAEPVETRLKI